MPGRATCRGRRVGDGEFIPDVMVHAATDEDERFTGVPALVVEVLAEGQREDVALHQSMYATARVRHLWIVDVAARALDAFRLGPAGYRLVTRHTAAGTGGPVTVDFGIAAVIRGLPTLL